MPLLETKGAASAQGFGMTLGGVGPVYIEDVFSTWLYTGNGSTQTITTGVDTGTKGGLIWVKMRSATASHCLFDSARASGSVLSTNNTDAASGGGSRLALTATGFDLQSGGGGFNQSGSTYASWTFREQPKFFDVVTWTANGSSDQEISHSLGSVPGCIIVKRINTSSAWSVWHRKNGLTDSTTGLSLNGTSAAFEQSWNVDGIGWISSTMFKPASGLIKDASGSNVDVSGTFVAYLFAHNAGGFGLTGADNAISCGAFTTNASGQATVTLGYEPQWLLVKRSSGTQGWLVFDTMRGMYINGSSVLEPNTSGSEFDTTGTSGIVAPNATGFSISGSLLMNPSSTYIYIAIRRGPMRTPTTGTSVFAPVAWSGTGTGAIYTIPANFPVDMQITRRRGSIDDNFTSTRLLGNVEYLTTNTSNATTNLGSGNGTNNSVGFASNVGVGVTGDWNAAGGRVAECFRRAPGFMDVVCYTGTGVARTVNHNLTVVPELMIVKTRSSASGWAVYSASLGNTSRLILNSDATASSPQTNWNSTTPTASVFSVSGASNTSSVTYVAQLFASCPGVSKVGSYTGTGSDITINCGFTGGARFVLLKAATNSFNSGQWYFWDSARGITSGNDPYLLLNDSGAEVTDTNYVDAASSGFVVKGGSPAGINESGGTYIYLAIA